MQAVFAPVVLPVDVGFGNTKCLKPKPQPTGKGVSVRDRYDEVLIESIVADYDESNDGLDGFHRDSCLIVRVGEKTCAVGANARKLLTGNSTGKTLNPDFCTTEHHRALVYAAMASQPSNRIDVLVLGRKRPPNPS